MIDVNYQEYKVVHAHRVWFYKKIKFYLKWIVTAYYLFCDKSIINPNYKEVMCVLLDSYSIYIVITTEEIIVCELGLFSWFWFGSQVYIFIFFSIGSMPFIIGVVCPSILCVSTKTHSLSLVLFETFFFNSSRSFLNSSPFCFAL